MPMDYFGAKTVQPCSLEWVYCLVEIKPAPSFAYGVGFELEMIFGEKAGKRRITVVKFNVETELCPG